MSYPRKTVIIPRITDQDLEPKAKEKTPIKSSKTIADREFISPYLGRQKQSVAQIDPNPHGNRKISSYQDPEPIKVADVKKNPEKYAVYGVRGSNDYRQMLINGVEDQNRDLEWKELDEVVSQGNDPFDSESVIEFDLSEYNQATDYNQFDDNQFDYNQFEQTNQYFEEELVNDFEEKKSTELEEDVKEKSNYNSPKNSFEFDPLEYQNQTKETNPPKKVNPIRKNPSSKYLGFPLPMLTIPEEDETIDNSEFINAQIDIINELFKSFSYKASVAGYHEGPTVIQFLIDIQAGTDVGKLNSFAKTLQMKLSATSLVIYDPIPGTNYAGIEIPGNTRRTVYLAQLLKSDQFWKDPDCLRIALGIDVSGQYVYADIDKMPHALIAGTTGSGKSICIHSTIISLLARMSPHQLKLILVDPKKAELSTYDNIPHLALPVITDLSKAAAALKWATNEMDRRYSLFQSTYVRSITSFNKVALQAGNPILPYIVIVVDELADLLGETGLDVENSIKRLTSLGRASGIHLIVALQRPSTDIVRGSIKNNISTRLAFRVSSPTDSSTILGRGGAEKLLGNGDMILSNAYGETRIQGVFVDELDVLKITGYFRNNYQTEYIISPDDLDVKNRSHNNDESDESIDPLFEEIARYVVEFKDGSANSIMKKMKISFNRVTKILDMMAKYQIVSEVVVKGKQRDVLIEPDQLDDYIAWILSENGE